MISFQVDLLSIKDRHLLSLPIAVSQEFPSRGMVMATGTINGHAFTAPLEPDGRGSHWLAIDKTLQQFVTAGDPVGLSIEPATTWPEPDITADLQAALDASPDALQTWQITTTMARWDWTRWVQSSAVPATRQKHIEVAVDKLRKGMRRPCCFNRSMCTVPDVSKSGVLSV